VFEIKVREGRRSDGLSGRQAAWEEIVLNIHRKFEYSVSIASNAILISVSEVASWLLEYRELSVGSRVGTFNRPYYERRDADWFSQTVHRLMGKGYLAIPYLYRAKVRTTYLVPYTERTYSKSSLTSSFKIRH
jgi:hypothetical protein